MPDISTLVVQILQIVWINILLSGDNAVVIALACRDLAPDRRKWAIVVGSGVAVVLRIVFTIFVVELRNLPYVNMVGALLLLWIAFDLLRQNHDEKDVRSSSSIWGAVRTIALADAFMSLDNVLAVTGAAHNSLPLIIFGIALSVPLIIFGSTLLLKLLKRFPILILAGAVLLGWVAGEMLASEKLLPIWFGELPDGVEHWLAAAGALLILVLAGLLHLVRSRHTRAPKPVDERA